MKLDRHQRCERCEFEAREGCVEMRRVWTEVDRALAEGDCRAARHGIRMPDAQVTVWCPMWWRRGRGV